MPKNKCLFQAKTLDDPRYSQWLIKKSDEVALCSHCKSCYVFNILYRCFYFYISRYCTALLKAASFVDLNPLGACIAEKQQSDEKLSNSENKQGLIMWWQPRQVRSSATAYRGNFNFHLSFSNVLHQGH